MTTWASWLKAAMVDAGMTRGDLIEAIGRRPDGRPKVDASRLSNWMARGTQPSFRNVLLVARALGVSEGSALEAAGYDRDGTVVRSHDGTSMEMVSQLALDPVEAQLVVAFVQGMRQTQSAH